MRRDIQGLRAIAVIWVVLFHADGLAPGGFAGVDVFFAISGFVITAMLLREWQANDRIDLPRFYMRRVKRLTPALAVMLLVVLAASAFLLSPFDVQSRTAQTALGAMALVGNGVIAMTSSGYFDPDAELNPLLHTWSLSVEEQFYLGFPLIILAGFMAIRRWSSRWPVLVMIGLLGVGSFGWAMLGPLAAVGQDSSLKLWVQVLAGFYSPFARAWEFAAGALLALVAHRAKMYNPWVTGVTAAVGMSGLVAALWMVTSDTMWPGPWTLLPIAATLLVIWAGLAGDASNPVQRLLSCGPMVKVGDWSYSIYLWHWPCIVVAAQVWPGRPGAVVAALLSIFPALASYYWVEQPLRRLSTSFRTISRRVMLPTMVPPTLAAALVLLGAQHLWWVPSARAYAASLGSIHAARQAGCDQRTPLSVLKRGECTWNEAAGGKPIFLMGDSQAGQLSEAVIDVAGATGRPVTIATTNACPFVLVSFADTRTGFSMYNNDCRQYVQQSMIFLQSARPSTVVIANSDAYWTESGFEAGPVGRPLTGSVDGRLEAFGGGMDLTIRTLRAAGHHVVVAHSTPRWQGRHAWSPQSCGMYRIVWGDCSQQMTVTEAGSISSAARNVLASRVKPAGAYLWDTWTTLCPDGVCSTTGDVGVQYRDAGHITAARSRSLGPELTRVVASADAMS